jgi:hypothetical protein
MIAPIRFEDAAGSPLRPGNLRPTDSKEEFIIMNTFTKKTVFGVAGIAAAAALAIGAAGPAMASTSHDSTSSESSNSQSSRTTSSLWSATSLSSFNDALDNIANDATVGNVSNESPVVVAPRVGDVLSGDAVASGNSVSAPISVPVTAPVASGNDASVANGIIDRVTQSVDLGSILSR